MPSVFQAKSGARGLAASLALLMALAGCTTPDVSSELQTLSTAFNDIGDDYRRTVGINPNSLREAEIDVLVRDRRKVLQINAECQLNPSACALEKSDVTPPVGSTARAELILQQISAYLASLDALAQAQTPGEIQTSAAGLIDGFSDFADKVGTGTFSGPALALSSRKDGLSQAAGFVANQQRYRVLRRVTTDAHPGLERVMLELRDRAVAAGAPSTDAAFLALEAAQDRMDEAKLNGSDAQYRRAIRDFLVALDRYRAFGKNGIVPRLELIVQAHAALVERLQKPASAKEIATLVKTLKAITEGL